MAKFLVIAEKPSVAQSLANGFTKPLSNITFFTRNTSSLYCR